MAKFVCTVCGYVYEGDAAPEKCPVCGVGADKFKAGQIGDGIAQILGSAAAIYNLGRTEVKNTAGDVKLFKTEPTPKYTIKKNGNSLEIWG